MANGDVKAVCRQINLYLLERSGGRPLDQLQDDSHGDSEAKFAEDISDTVGLGDVNVSGVYLTVDAPATDRERSEWKRARRFVLDKVTCSDIREVPG